MKKILSLICAILFLGCGGNGKKTRHIECKKVMLMPSETIYQSDTTIDEVIGDSVTLSGEVGAYSYFFSKENDEVRVYTRYEEAAVIQKKIEGKTRVGAVVLSLVDDSATIVYDCK